MSSESHCLDPLIPTQKKTLTNCLRKRGHNYQVQLPQIQFTGEWHRQSHKKSSLEVEKEENEHKSETSFLFWKSYQLVEQTGQCNSLCYEPTTVNGFKKECGWKMSSSLGTSSINSGGWSDFWSGLVRWVIRFARTVSWIYFCTLVLQTLQCLCFSVSCILYLFLFYKLIVLVVCNCILSTYCKMCAFDDLLTYLLTVSSLTGTYSFIRCFCLRLLYGRFMCVER